MSHDVMWTLSIMDSRGHVTFMAQNSQVKCVNVPRFGFLFVRLIRLLIMMKMMDDTSATSLGKSIAPSRLLGPRGKPEPRWSSCVRTTHGLCCRATQSAVVHTAVRSSFRAKRRGVKLPERRGSWRLLFCSFVFFLASLLCAGEKARPQCILGYAVSAKGLSGAAVKLAAARRPRALFWGVNDHRSTNFLLAGLKMTTCSQIKLFLSRFRHIDQFCPCFQVFSQFGFN